MRIQLGMTQCSGKGGLDQHGVAFDAAFIEKALEGLVPFLPMFRLFVVTAFESLHGGYQHRGYRTDSSKDLLEKFHTKKLVLA